MKRRHFIALIGGATVAWPLAVRAQQTAMPVVGFVSAMSSSDAASPLVSAFREGLRQTGYVEGRNVTIEYRHEGGRIDRLSAAVFDLIKHPLTAIAALGTVPAQAVKEATTTVPIVFVTGDDPVKAGLVASFNRPGGNVTGVTFVSSALGAKRLQLLRSLTPGAELIGLLTDTHSPESQNQAEDQKAAARALAQKLLVLNVSTDDDIDAAFATLAREHAAALSIAGGPFLASRRDRIISLAERHALPAMYTFRDFTVDGGLISYGASFPEAMRQAGIYLGRILRGDKPPDLPILQPVKFELVINLRTARVLHLEIPPTLLALADEVIE